MMAFLVALTAVIVASLCVVGAFFLSFFMAGVIHRALCRLFGWPYP